MTPQLSPERVGSGQAGVNDLLKSPVRRDILELLELAAGEDPESGLGLSAAELGERMGLHVTTVRFHLDQMVRVGMLSTRFLRGRVGRPRKVYFLPPPERARVATDAYSALSGLLAEAWPSADPAAEQVSPREAGHHWVQDHMPGEDPTPPPARTVGQWIGKIGRVFDLFDQWGYQPDLATAGNGRAAQLTVTDCPFQDVAAVRPDVVCAVHQGLIEGVLDQAGEPSAEVTLRPFVGPRTCTIHITQGRNPRE